MNTTTEEEHMFNIIYFMLLSVTCQCSASSPRLILKIEFFFVELTASSTCRANHKYQILHQENILRITMDKQLNRNRLCCLHAPVSPTLISKPNPSKSRFLLRCTQVPANGTKLRTSLSCVISVHYHNSNALADSQRNSGVLSERLVLGNLGLGLWQQGSPISVWLLS